MTPLQRVYPRTTTIALFVNMKRVRCNSRFVDALYKLRDSRDKPPRTSWFMQFDLSFIHFQGKRLFSLF